MAEELRFFLRTAIYTILIAVIYWFASYEWSGSVMLVFVSLASALIVLVTFVAVSATHDELDPKVGSPIHRFGSIVGRLIGFSTPRRGADHDPLAAGLEPIPSGSIWPLTAAGSAMMLGLGLVYGPWLTAPGIALGIVSVWGWITQMDAS